MRFATGDAAALAAALIRLFSVSEAERQAIGARGRAWVVDHFGAKATATLTLKLYAEIAASRNGGVEARDLGPQRR
jgi:glycosyltransferase involved in cell wall biosynthesis